MAGSPAVRIHIHNEMAFGELFADYSKPRLEEGDGRRFFELVCGQDLERIICKPKTSPYPLTWIKVKNPGLLTGCRTQGNV